MRPRRRPAVTLIEVLIVISIMTILAASVLPSANPSVRDQLYAAADVLAADLAYARSLAITHNSAYRISFDAAGEQYVLEHSGPSTALDTLPRSALRASTEENTQLVMRLGELPHQALPVELHSVQALASQPQAAGDVEFNSLGATTRPEDTAIWLSAGAGGERRYVRVRVSAATGLTWIENFRASPPVAAAVPASSPANVGP